jgi:hypothetical protein
MTALRFAVPAALVGIDEDAYPLGGGSPTDAGLGIQLIQNSRGLDANLCRSWGFAFPLATPPTVCEALGVTLGAWGVDISPRKRQVAWYLEAKFGVGELVDAVAYTEGRRSPQPWSPALWQQASKVVQLVGTGADATYGPILCAVRPGPLEVGLALRCLELDPTVRFGTVAWAEELAIHGTASMAPGGPGWPTPPAAIVRLSDGVGAAATPLSAWHQVTDPRTVLVANDTVGVWPELTLRERRRVPPSGVLGWQIRAVSSLTMTSLLLTEQVLT